MRDIIIEFIGTAMLFLGGYLWVIMIIALADWMV